ncbi:MAG: class I SAM-dependent methyltransferase [Actinomycetota bacterium]
MSERYTYGDSELAAERLGLVARVFEPTTRAFLERSVTAAPTLAYDLGCGPGHTTRLVGTVTGAEWVVGLDRSGPFLERAELDAPPGISFRAHDVREVPFPEGAADLIYCRLLLAHLVDPPGVVSRWTTQLAPGGLALLDELEAIETADPVFGAYLRDVALPVVEAQGARLLAGPVLAAMPDPTGMERIADDVVSFTPSAAESARIFGMNLAVLVDRDEVSLQPALAAYLAAIADGTRRPEPVVWRMRQLAFRRTAVSVASASD